MTMPQQRVYSVEEYLQMEEKADFRSEYRFGDIIAMTGTTPEHSLILSNSIREAGNALARARRGAGRIEGGV